MVNHSREYIKLKLKLAGLSSSNWNHSLVDQFLMQMSRQQLFADSRFAVSLQLTPQLSHLLNHFCGGQSYLSRK